MELAAIGPGASEKAIRTVTAPRSALGPGVGLHAYDIVVLVVYFIVVIGVGVWVSRSGGRGRAGEAEACSSPAGPGVGGQVDRWRAGQGSTGAEVEGPSGITLASPFF